MDDEGSTSSVYMAVGRQLLRESGAPAANIALMTVDAARAAVRGTAGSVRAELEALDDAIGAAEAALADYSPFVVSLVERAARELRITV